MRSQFFLFIVLFHILTPTERSMVLSIRHRTPPLRKACGVLLTALTLVFAPACVAQTFSLPSRVSRDGPASSSQMPPPPISAMKPQGRAHGNAWARQFYLQVRRCWRHPQNYDRDPVEAVFVIKLTRTGHLDGSPTPLQLPKTDYEKRYHASALAALVTCQPYDLPQDAYDRWRRFEPVFHERAR
jgi:hypothetical protein